MLFVSWHDPDYVLFASSFQMSATFLSLARFICRYVDFCFLSLLDFFYFFDTHNVLWAPQDSCWCELNVGLWLASLHTWQGSPDCACVSSGPSHAHMKSGHYQSPSSSYGGSVSSYSHVAPSSQGSMIQSSGPYDSSSSSSTSLSFSPSSCSNLNMQSSQGETGIAV